MFVYATSPKNDVSFIIIKNKSKVNWFCDHHIGLIEFKNGEMVYENEEPISMLEQKGIVSRLACG